MSKKIIGIHGIREREKNDFYATPPEAVELFLDNFKLKGTILEPSCGMGHISEVLKSEGYDVISKDLIDRGYGITGCDFMNETETYDTVITNPPFKIAKEFVEKGLEVANHQVIMLLKLQFLESEARRDFFANTPLKEIYVHSKRIACWKGGEPLNEKGKKWAGTQAYAWFVWEHGYKGEPTIRWI